MTFYCLQSTADETIIIVVGDKDLLFLMFHFLQSRWKGYKQRKEYLRRLNELEGNMDAVLKVGRVLKLISGS